MTVLHLDPPPSRPHLRLVADTGSTTRDHRYRDEARLGEAARAMNTLTVRFALADSRPLDPDALRVVLAVRQSRHHRIDRLRSDDIWQLMFVDIITWCRARHLDVPTGCAEAIAVMIEAGDDCGAWSDDSDPSAALFEALVDCTGGIFGPDDDVRPNPARRRSVRSGRVQK